jgi:hypothetical protein
MPRRNKRLPEEPEARPQLRSAAPEWAEVDGYQIRTVGGDKPYICPGCDHSIRIGLQHLVVVPTDAPDERRHWHTECWRRELRRTGGNR